MKPLLVLAAVSTVLAGCSSTDSGDSIKIHERQSSIDNTQVIVDRTAGELDARTHYINAGWFGGSGAVVEYTAAVPTRTSLHLANVSGPITIRNIAGDVQISQVSGPISASLGRVTGDRTIKVDTVTGGTVLQIARNSDVTIDVKSVSGDVNTFFPAGGDKGFVGKTVHGRVGDGTATIDVNSVSGTVSVNPQ